MYVDRVERASECVREKMNNRTHASERRGVCVWMCVSVAFQDGGRKGWQESGRKKGERLPAWCIGRVSLFPETSMSDSAGADLQRRRRHGPSNVLRGLNEMSRESLFASAASLLTVSLLPTTSQSMIVLSISSLTSYLGGNHSVVFSSTHLQPGTTGTYITSCYHSTTNLCTTGAHERLLLPG